MEKLYNTAYDKSYETGCCRPMLDRYLTIDYTAISDQLNTLTYFFILDKPNKRHNKIINWLSHNIGCQIMFGVINLISTARIRGEGSLRALEP